MKNITFFLIFDTLCNDIKWHCSLKKKGGGKNLYTCLFLFIIYLFFNKHHIQL